MARGLRWLRGAWSGLALFVLNVGVVLALVNFALGVYLRRTEPPPGKVPGIRADLLRARAYPLWTDAALDELVRESARELVWEPYTDCADKRIGGRFVNVEAGGFRRSTAQGPWPPERRSYNVFVFGGSTAFGYGVTDDDTIASRLQPLLPAVGERQIRIYNFGRSGYYSTQERILFERILTAGHAIDAAVFVDGLNDFSRADDIPFSAMRIGPCFSTPKPQHAYQQAFDALPIVVFATRLQDAFGLTHAPSMLGVQTRQPDYEDPKRAALVIDRWLLSKAMIEGMAATRGVATIFVWQPIATYRFPPATTGHWNVEGANGYAGFGYVRMAERVATNPIGPNFLWCADVGENGTEALYVDAVHYSPDMAGRVARCIADGVRDRRLLH